MQPCKTRSGRLLHRFSNSVQCLEQALKEPAQGCLVIRSGAVEWFIYIHQGRITYLTHSIEPLDRLNSHLTALGRRNAAITPDVRAQLRVQMQHTLLHADIPTADYEGLRGLLHSATVDLETAQTLAMKLSVDALESLLLVQEGAYGFYPMETSLPGIAPFDLEPLRQASQQYLQSWQAFGSLLWSPYQRPFLTQTPHPLLETVVDGMSKPLGQLLTGFSLRHLALFLDHSEIDLIKALYPFILEGSVNLHDPQPTYDALPRYQRRSGGGSPSTTAASWLEGMSYQPGDRALDFSVNQPHIVCIHSNSVVLDALRQHLGADFHLSLFSSAVQALIALPDLRPDLILLGLSMPELDSWELCRLLRHHPALEQIPVLMLRSQSGLVEQSRAKLSGAADIVAESLSQSEWLALISHYLG